LKIGNLQHSIGDEVQDFDLDLVLDLDSFFDRPRRTASVWSKSMTKSKSRFARCDLDTASQFVFIDNP
jgi:hypothetical protein